MIYLITCVAACKHSRSNARYLVLLLAILIVLHCFAVSGQTSETSAEKVRLIADSIGAQLAQIQDMSCAVNTVYSGTQSPEYARNRIRILETLAAQGHVSRKDTAEEIDALKKQAEQPQPASLEMEPAATSWRCRQDGSFWVAQPGTYKDAGGVIYVGYDGSTCRTYDPLRNRGAILKQPERPKSDPYFGLSANEMAVEEFLRKAIDSGTVSYEEATSDGGAIEYTVTAVVPGDGEGRPHRFAKIWLDPAKGFMPKRINSGIAAGPAHDSYLVLGEMRDIVHEEVLPGVWFPTAATVDHHEVANVPNPEKPPDQWPLVAFPSTAHTRMSLKDVRVNTGLQDKDFRIEFPQGTVVYDQLADARLVVGGVDKAIDNELVRTVPRAADVTPGTGSEDAGSGGAGATTVIQIQTERWKIIVASVMLCVLAGVVFLAVLKLRGRRRP